MSDLKLASKKMENPADLGRARQRKLKRQGDAVIPAAEQKPTRTRSAARRPSTIGPSIRERVVNEKVKIEKVALPQIQEKLNLKRIPAVKKLPHITATPRQGSAIEPAVRSMRQKEPRQRINLYKASPHPESQRKTGTNAGTLPRKSRRVFEAKSEAAPPVMVRGGLGGMAFGRTASSKLASKKAPRRRIDVPLNVPGAEMRLPAIPLLHFGWRAVSLLMVLMMAACLALIWKSPTFKVMGMKTDGLQRLTMSDLNAVARLTGKSIFSINPKAVDGQLQQAFPELSKISVKVNLPASVSVVVSERQPVIAWMQDGKETWVDADGVSFPARGTISDTLVRVEGYGTPPGLIQPFSTVELPPGTSEVTATTTITSSLRLAPDLVSAILSLGEKMPQDTLLVYDSEHGLGWNDPKGWEVFFGSEDQDMDMKLAVYQSLVERLESEGIQPALISVEYVHAPYYRMER